MVLSSVMVLSLLATHLNVNVPAVINILLSTVVALAALLGAYLRYTKRTSRLPPGPSFWSRKDKVPSSYPWITYANWKERYGEQWHILDGTAGQ